MDNSFSNSSFQKLADITLKTEDGSVFKAHKILLAQVSKYFKVLFCGDFLHCNNETFVPIVKGEVLHEILCNIYQEKDIITPENVADILIVSDYLIMDELFNACKSFIHEDGITIENCIQVYDCAWKTDLVKVKDKCKRFILIHTEEAFNKSKTKISDLPLPAFKEILECDNLNISEESYVWNNVMSWIKGNEPHGITNFPELLKYIRLQEMGELTEEIELPPVDMDNPFSFDFGITIVNQRAAISLMIELAKNLPLSATGLRSPRIPNNIYFICKQVLGRKVEFYITYDDNFDYLYTMGNHPMLRDLGYMDICIAGRFAYFSFYNDATLLKAFDFIDEVWTTISSVPEGRVLYTLASANDDIYALGGMSITDRVHGLFNPFGGVVILNVLNILNPEDMEDEENDIFHMDLRRDEIFDLEDFIADRIEDELDGFPFGERRQFFLEDEVEQNENEIQDGEDNDTEVNSDLASDEEIEIMELYSDEAILSEYENFYTDVEERENEEADGLSEDFDEIPSDEANDQNEAFVETINDDVEDLNTVLVEAEEQSANNWVNSEFEETAYNRTDVMQAEIIENVEISNMDEDVFSTPIEEANNENESFHEIINVTEDLSTNSIEMQDQSANRISNDTEEVTDNEISSLSSDMNGIFETNNRNYGFEETANNRNEDFTAIVNENIENQEADTDGIQNQTAYNVNNNGFEEAMDVETGSISSFVNEGENNESINGNENLDENLNNEAQNLSRDSDDMQYEEVDDRHSDTDRAIRDEDSDLNFDMDDTEDEEFAEIPATINRFTVAQRYDRESNSWQLIAPMNPMHIARAVTLNNNIYVIGENMNLEGMICQVYYPDSNSWRIIPNPEFYRSDCAVAAFRDKLYLIGGHGRHFNELKKVEEYNPSENLWRTLPDLPFAYMEPECIVIKNSLIVFDQVFMWGSERQIAVYWNAEEQSWCKAGFIDKDMIRQIRLCKIIRIHNQNVLKELIEKHKRNRSIWGKSSLSHLYFDELETRS